MSLKVAVILPAPYSGGVVRSLINICRMLVIGARSCGDELQLTVGLPKGQSWSLRNTEIFSSLGIQTRFFEIKKIRHESLLGSYACLDVDLDYDFQPEVICFEDGVANFEDADFWYLISDAVPGPLPAHRKYACLVYDYANRYVPEIFHEGQWCDFHFRTEATAIAAFVVTTTAQTRLDVINFAGADPARVHVFPIEFDPIDKAELGTDKLKESGEISKDYILWPTIISGHENHLPVLKDLESFMSDNDFRVVIIGKGTSSFDPENDRPSVRHPYVASIRDFVACSPTLRGRLAFMDFVSDEKLLMLMREAICVLHTSRGDNGSYTVVEAAWQGTPSLSNRYPAMEDVGRYFGLPLVFFDFYRPGSLAEGLRCIRRDREAICGRLPSRQSLANFSYENLAAKYWQLFSTNMKLALEAD